MGGAAPAVLVTPFRPSTSDFPGEVIPVDIPVYHAGQGKLLPSPRFVTRFVSVEAARAATPRTVIESVL